MCERERERKGSGGEEEGTDVSLDESGKLRRDEFLYDEVFHIVKVRPIAFLLELKEVSDSERPLVVFRRFYSVSSRLSYLLYAVLGCLSCIQ